jgi:hypothetical protein
MMVSSPIVGRQHLGVRYGPISVMEAESIRGIVDRFVSGDVENVEVNTFRQLTYAMHYMRDLIRESKDAVASTGRGGPVTNLSSSSSYRLRSSFYLRNCSSISFCAASSRFCCSKKSV